MRYGFKHTKWTKELDDKLLSEIQKGCNLRQLTMSLNMGPAKIYERLDEMGFEGLKDARKVMMG